MAHPIKALAVNNDLFATSPQQAIHQQATHLQATPQHVTPLQPQRISEFVFPAGLQRDGRAVPLPLSLVLSMLGHLSHSSDSRWLSCIGLPHTSKKECLQSGLDWQRFLQVFPSNKLAVLELTERVLQSGRSHTVVAWLPAALSEKDMAKLEAAALAGNCQAILIRHR